MRNFLLGLVAVFGFNGALSAHHSVAASYDIDRMVPLVGVLTSVSVINPHVKVVLTETAQDGTETTWMVEMAPPNAMKRRGFDPRTLKPGQQVVLESWLRKDGQKEATARTIVMPDGKRVDVGDALGWSMVPVPK